MNLVPLTPVPMPNAITTVGTLTADDLGKHVTVWSDDRQSVRAQGIVDKIGHETSPTGPVTWIGLRNTDGWRWYKQLPSVTPIGL
jgi:hypothetical protein